MPTHSASDELALLRSSAAELTILNEIATAISGVWELDQVIALIVEKCIKHLRVEQATVSLLEEGNTEKPFQTMIRKTDESSTNIPYHFGVQLSAWMMKNQKPLLINDVHDDPRFFLPDEQQFLVHSLLSVPILHNGQLIGVLNTFNKQSSQGFSYSDQRLLSIIATQSAQVIESTRLYAQEKTLLRIEEDLRIAREIQANLLPQTNPRIPGYDIAGYSISAREIGGDYYDFIPLDDHRMALCLGDISGKGIAAALLMANLQAVLRSNAQTCTSCVECLEKTNTYLYHSTDTNQFATLFLGVLNYQEHTLRYVKAGHPPPMYFTHDGSSTRLDTGGTVLGFLPETKYKDEIISIQPGGTIVLYSDGIIEAANRNDDFYDEFRLEEQIREHLGLSAGDLIKSIISSANHFSDTENQQDDMTLLVLKRLE